MSDCWQDVLSAFEAPTEFQIAERHISAVESACRKMQHGLEVRECQLAARTVNALRLLLVKNADVYTPLLQEFLKQDKHANNPLGVDKPGLEEQES